jgi:hypothetical protein
MKTFELKETYRKPLRVTCQGLKEFEDGPGLQKICDDWDEARKLAEEKTPKSDLARHLTDIDVLFSDFIDLHFFVQSQLKAAS